jgi:poly-beta-hydroxybutyrate-responsive repressor
MSAPRESSCHVLPKNFLRPCLLLLLREHPAHGYELSDRLQDLGFGPEDHGRLYRALRRLEADGQVRSRWTPSESGPYRRVYELTEVGTDALRDEARELEQASHILDDFLGRCADSDGAMLPVQRG